MTVEIPLLIQMIGSVGFPIAITIFLLTEMRKTLKENTSALIELKIVIKERLR